MHPRSRSLVPVAFSLALASLAILSGHAQAQTSDPAHRVDSIFADVSGPTSPGCAVSVMRDGAPVYERGYGMANLSYGIPITPRSVFHVASVSKHFTAMAVELLVNEGKVSWDDDIRDHVPEVPDFGTPITLRHLVHHTSGIRDQWSLLSMAGWRWEADVVTQKDVLDITSRQTALNFEPGERYLYSNTGFTLLAVVVERVSGQSLREFTTERIFEPLGMEQTHFHDDHQMLVRNRAWAYEPDDDGLWGWRNSIPDFDVVGATSLFTTAHDMAAWDRNFVTGVVGGEDALRRLRSRFVLTSGDTIGYAHGLGLGSQRGLRTEGHGGADAGYRSNFLRFPDQGLSVVVLCNFPSADPGGRAERVAEAYLADQMEPREEEDGGVSDEPTASVPGERLRELVGVYRGELPNQVLVVEQSADTLRFRDGPRLRPLGEGRFEIGESGDVLTFRRGEDGAFVAEAGFGRGVQHAVWRPDARELSRYEGTWTSDEVGTDYRLELGDDGALWAHHRKLDSVRLEPLSPGVFGLRGNIADFRHDDAGRPVGFSLSSGRVWNVAFERAGA